VKDLIHVVDRLHTDLACVASRALGGPTQFHDPPKKLPTESPLRRTLERAADDLRANRDMRNDLDHLLVRPKPGKKDIERFPALGDVVKSALGNKSFRDHEIEDFVAKTTARAFTVSVQCEDLVHAFLVAEHGSELFWNEFPATIATREDGPGYGLVMARRHLDALDAALRRAENGIAGG
jgi:hypothetical protein